MKRIRCLLITFALLITGGAVQAQTEVAPRLLRNGDVLRMVEENVEPELIVAKILTSPCNFDVFPPVLRDLRRRGVPEEVLRAMKAAPNGPPALAEVDPNVTPAPRIEIPEGTIIQVEKVKETSSAKVKEGDLITFLAKRRIYVNNVMVLERGAVAKARIVKARSAKPLGRAGMLAWEMEYIVGIDGTCIPMKAKRRESNCSVSRRSSGDRSSDFSLLVTSSIDLGIEKR